MAVEVWIDDHEPGEPRSIERSKHCCTTPHDRSQPSDLGLDAVLTFANRIPGRNIPVDLMRDEVAALSPIHTFHVLGSVDLSNQAKLVGLKLPNIVCGPDATMGGQGETAHIRVEIAR